jgi:hypothetical protein
MKRLLLMIATAALIAPLGAHARDGWGFEPRMQAQGQQHAKKDPGQHQRSGRDARRDERPERDERRQGRLTEEERRELHRDLDRANREIYRSGGKGR